MIEIVPCQGRVEELVGFAARLNSEAEHHIGFFGEGEADVRLSLAECLIPPSEGFCLAYEADQLVGIFGVDADPEIDRAWLFGPLVEHRDWHAIAHQLYGSVLPLIPAGIRDRDLFCDVQNVHMDEFAKRHGFARRSENAVLMLARESYRPFAKRLSQVIAYRWSFFDEFEELHRTLFPNAYFTARQMVEKLDGNHQLFLAVEADQLLGYHFCKIEPDAESGYVDFIGTTSAARGRGVGADLLAEGIDWMLAAPTTRKIDLTVDTDNMAARSLYAKFGFITERVMRGYRQQVVNP